MNELQLIKRKRNLIKAKQLQNKDWYDCTYEERLFVKEITERYGYIHNNRRFNEFDAINYECEFLNNFHKYWQNKKYIKDSFDEEYERQRKIFYLRVLNQVEREQKKLYFQSQCNPLSKTKIENIEKDKDIEILVQQYSGLNDDKLLNIFRRIRDSYYRRYSMWYMETESYSRYMFETEKKLKALKLVLNSREHIKRKNSIDGCNINYKTRKVKNFNVGRKTYLKPRKNRKGNIIGYTKVY